MAKKSFFLLGTNKGRKNRPKKNPLDKGFKSLKKKKPLKELTKKAKILKREFSSEFNAARGSINVGRIKSSARRSSAASRPEEIFRG